MHAAQNPSMQQQQFDEAEFYKNFGVMTSEGMPIQDANNYMHNHGPGIFPELIKPEVHQV